MLSILYCEECDLKLRTYGAYVSELYDVIVQEYLINETISYFLITDKDFSKLATATKFLEGRGYVVSCETAPDRVSVKPLGIRCYDQFDGCHCHVCFKPNEHKEKD
jgi:hypothetical protein